MKIFESVKSLRFWSLALGAASVTPLAYFMYQNWLFSQWAKEQSENGAFICGTGIVALFSLCIVIGAVFSAKGSLLGLMGYLKIEKPRPSIRILEIALVGAVLILAVATMFLFN